MALKLHPLNRATLRLREWILIASLRSARATKGGWEKQTGESSPTGDAAGMSRLKNVDIPEIRTLVKLGKSKAEVARTYGVGRATICDVISGRTWNHVA